MKMKELSLLFIMLSLMFLTSCQAVSDIFQAGLTIGTVIAAAIIGVIAFVITNLIGSGK